MEMKMRLLLLSIALMVFGSSAYADDHTEIADRPVEIWTCSFNEGKTVDDLNAWYADMNKFGDSMQNSQWNSFM
jgi:hypothetical protein